MAAKTEMTPKQRRWFFANHEPQSYEVLAFDTETTGVTGKDQVVQVSAVGRKKDGSLDKYNTYVKPTVPISPYAQRVHGISMNMLKDEPSFKQIRPELQQLIDKADTVLGVNLHFDKRILEGQGLELPEEKVKDMMHVGWQYDLDTGGDGKLSLDDLMKELDVHMEPGERHGSMGDALATLEVYESLLEGDYEMLEERKDQ